MNVPAKYAKSPLCEPNAVVKIASIAAIPATRYSLFIIDSP